MKLDGKDITDAELSELSPEELQRVEIGGVRPWRFVDFGSEESVP